MRLKDIRPEFVEFIPRQLEDGILYISERYKTASHKCACGCGEKVVTPLSPVEWQLSKSGDTVSLYPSIGNWNYSCRSHYWIRNNRIQWAGPMTKRQIAQVQRKDRADKERHIVAQNARKSRAIDESHVVEEMQVASKKSWLARTYETIRKWLSGSSS